MNNFIKNTPYYGGYFPYQYMYQGFPFWGYSPGILPFLRQADYGGTPYVFNLEKLVKENENFRTAIWTNRYMQIVCMSINMNEDIGIEIHPDTDQVLVIVEGKALTKIGETRENLNYQVMLNPGQIICIPAGKWHNVVNVGNMNLKLLTIYAPPEYPKGVIKEIKGE